MEVASTDELLMLLKIEFTQTKKRETIFMHGRRWLTNVWGEYMTYREVKR